MNIELSSAHIWSLDSWIEEQTMNDNNEIFIQMDEIPNDEFLNKQIKVDYLFLKGCRIRFFYLPKEIDVIDCIEKQLAFYRKRNTGFERPFNWKSYRRKLKLLKSDDNSKDNKTNIDQVLSKS